MNRLPGRHSLFWRLAVLLIGFCLAVIWLSWSIGQYMQRQGYHLAADAQATLVEYAAEAQAVWRTGEASALDRWLADFSAREDTWAVVVGHDLQSLGSRGLSAEERDHLTFLRRLDWPMSRRSARLPYLGIPFPDEPEHGQLVIQLPERFKPDGYHPSWQLLVHGLLPAAMALLFCVLLYRLLIAPLEVLREQANALRDEQLGTRAPPQVSRRQDELGDLARAFDHMAGRLENTLVFQRQLLRNLSHELRTPLSRLRVAGENEQDLGALRLRLEREVQGMQQLIGNTLELVWLDTERPQLPLEPIEVGALWEIIAEDACFESGWSRQRLVCELPDDCRVVGNLNGLAQALENVLRNAIRHSPEGATVRFGGERHASHWNLWLEDQGGGVPEDDLERIFDAFIRLNSARPGGGGYGLGLSIARSSVQLQGGQLRAQNHGSGLRVTLRMTAA
ncbi:histidine kinase sensor domain-containing protein [Stutzerimonas azotifigens]|uniref:histidine kinase n=1 Tax=Stutzerimonas azotifigens TaxID=291995 RepID=A0ABR5Z2U3_9GAMM|nr:histidine kinase sensor domain-containing protein [Stutzerimonas azotifigens]MBA1274485.1 HAMP domain-containing protein [Stutzerimonas azotifigens]